MAVVATLVSSGGCVGRRQPPPYASRNRHRSHHSRKKRKKAKKGDTRETSHIVILFGAHPVFAYFSDPGTPQSGRAKEVFRFAPIA